MRIAIVDDMKMTVEILRRIITTMAPQHEIAWIANDGKEAVEKCMRDTPDILLMDLVMPLMNGAAATREIMAKCPCPILIVTSSMSGNAAMVFEAMSYGALDAVNTPSLGTGGDMAGAAQLLGKIEKISLLCKPASTHERKKFKDIDLRDETPSSAPFLLAIGASTGGPAALAQILSEIPAGFIAATVIIQHIDKQFAPGLAEWLCSSSKTRIQVAAEGETPLPGRIYLASTNDHLVITPEMTFSYTVEPREQAYRPSVDVFFDSLCRHWPRRGVAVLLTGIGRDGAQGLLALKKNGWTTIAQNQESCVVYGMPKAAAGLGAASMTLPPIEIGRKIARIKI